MDRCVHAWADLSTCRPIGMTVGAIPWDKIVDWCRYHDLEREHADAVIHVIRTLDIAHGEQRAAEQAAKTATGGHRR